MKSDSAIAGHLIKQMDKEGGAKTESVETDIELVMRDLMCQIMHILYEVCCYATGIDPGKTQAKLFIQII